MRKNSWISLAAMCLFLLLVPGYPVCADQQIGAITIKDGSMQYVNGKPSRAVLAKEVPIGKGVVCKENAEIVWHTGGPVESCTLKNTVTLPMPSPSAVLVFRGGEKIYFDRQTRILKGTAENGTRIGNIQAKAGEVIELDSQTRLRRVVLANDVQLGRATWKKDTVLDFHPNGNIAQGTLAKDIQVVQGGAVLKAGTRIRATESGSLSIAQ